MIDKTGYYWHGDSPNDIDEYLKAYSECSSIEVKPIICNNCGSDAFHLIVDQSEDAIQVKCPRCDYKKIILDCDDVWQNAKPRLRKCPECKAKEYNIKVGFVRRESGSVKWVYIGNRCSNCGLLGSYLDWKVDYEPTDEMEINI